LLAPLAACGPGEEPVGRLSAQVGAVNLPFPQRAMVPVTFEAEREADSSGELRVFVHLLDGRGQVLRTFDHPLPAPWRPGTRITDPLELWQSALTPPLDPGTYDLTVGLYDAAGHRFVLETAAPEVADREYRIAAVTVSPPADGPRVSFGGAFLELERRGDKQTLARRFLAGEGEILFTDLAGPLEVVFDLWIPREDEVALRLVLEQGATVPAVDIRSDCQKEPSRIEGPGHHTVSLGLAAPGETGSCTLTLTPNFVYLDLSGFSKRSASLELLTWGAGVV
jgi:hypothetical protein